MISLPFSQRIEMRYLAAFNKNKEVFEYNIKYYYYYYYSDFFVAGAWTENRERKNMEN